MTDVGARGGATGLPGRAPRGDEWAQAVESLHGLANALSVRSHYAEGHPAIVRADEGVAQGFAKLLEQLPELVLALLDGEVVVCERPMPELRQRLAAVTDAMNRHHVECIVVQHGVTARECTLVAQTLSGKPDAAVREDAERRLTHVLLRYAAIDTQGEDRRRTVATPHFVGDVRALFATVARTAAEDATLDLAPTRALAERIVDACAARSVAVVQRCVVPGEEDGAAHAANVATMVASMSLAARLTSTLTIDLTAAALLHDVGHLMMPAEMRGVPEPLLDEPQKAVFENHCFVGARLLLGAGCPPLWVAAALEHHRGVDGAGYPALSTAEGPHALVRLVALASFVDSKCARVLARDDVATHTPDDALRLAGSLQARFFAPEDLVLCRRALGMFPPGTTVELSDRRVAVVRQPSGNPFRPEVEILCGPDAQKRVDLESIDPTEDRHRLSIVRAIAPPLVLWEAQLQPVEAEPDELDDLESLPTPLPIAAAPPAGPSERPPQFVFRRPSTAPKLQVTVPPVSMSVPPEPLTSSAPPRALAADDAAFEVDSELALLERLGSLEQIPVVRVTRAELAGLRLDHRAGFLLSMCDGATSIDVLLDVSGLPRTAVLRVLDELLYAGVIALV